MQKFTSTHPIRRIISTLIKEKEHELKKLNNLTIRTDQTLEGVWLFQHFIQENNIRFFELAMDKGILLPTDICESVCREGNIEILKLLLKNGRTLTEKCLTIAIEKGDKKLFKFLLKKKCPMSELTFLEAVRKDDIWFVFELNEVYCEYPFSIITTAAERDSFEIVKFLIDEAYPLEQDALRIAICNGNDKIINLLIGDDRIFLTTEIAAVAADMGNLPLLKILHENGCDWDVNVYKGVIDYERDFNIAIYAFENGCPFTNEFIDTLKESVCVKTCERMLSLLCGNGVKKIKIEYQ